MTPAHLRLQRLRRALVFWQAGKADGPLAEFYRQHAADIERQTAELEEEIRREEARNDGQYINSVDK